jgi:hypothetical protein
MAVMAPTAAAMPSGAPENVEVWMNGSRSNGANAASVATSADTGTTPPPSALPTRSMSGTTPARSAPHQ